MPYFSITPSPNAPPHFEGNSTPFHTHLVDNTASFSQYDVPPFKTASQRRSHFADRSHRRAVPYHSTDIITTDFCYGFLSFPEIRLNIPGGISFDLMQYWDGQPVRFVCCERRRGGREGDDSSSVSSVDSGRTSGTSGEGKKREKKKAEEKGKGGGLGAIGGQKGPGDPFWVVVFEAVLDDHEEEEASKVGMPDEEVPSRIPHTRDTAHVIRHDNHAVPPVQHAAHGSKVPLGMHGTAQVHGTNGMAQAQGKLDEQVSIEDQAHLREDID